MIALAPRQELTLAIYPTARGFGWAALAGPLAPYDGGLFEAPKDKNRVCLARIEELLERLQPETTMAARRTVRRTGFPNGRGWLSAIMSF